MMSKLIEMSRIGICPIGFLIVPESGLNLRGLLPGTRADWIGLEKKGMNWKGMDWKKIYSKGIGLKRILL